MRRGDDMLDQLDLGWEEDEPRRRRGAPPSRQQRKRRRDRRRRKGRSSAALVISLVLQLGLGAGVYWGVGQIQENQSIKEFLSADYEQGDMGEEITFQVREDEFGAAIAANLLDAGVIKSQAAFVQICDTERAECEGIQPGAYKVQRSSPAKVVFDILINPDNKLTTSFFLREGLSVIESLKRLAGQPGLPLAAIQAAANPPPGTRISRSR